MIRTLLIVVSVLFKYVSEMNFNYRSSQCIVVSEKRRGICTTRLSRFTIEMWIHSRTADPHNIPASTYGRKDKNKLECTTWQTRRSQYPYQFLTLLSAKFAFNLLFWACNLPHLSIQSIYFDFWGSSVQPEWLHPSVLHRLPPKVTSLVTRQFYRQSRSAEFSII